MSKAEVKRHQQELQRRILELIRDFELKTNWRVENVAYNPAVSTVPTKKPKVRARAKVCESARLLRTRQGAEWYIDRGVGALPREACGSSAGTRSSAGV